MHHIIKGQNSRIRLALNQSIGRKDITVLTRAATITTHLLSQGFYLCLDERSSETGTLNLSVETRDATTTKTIINILEGDQNVSPESLQVKSLDCECSIN